jgi:hypothetical protein
VRKEKRSAPKTGSGGCGRSGDIVGDEGDPGAQQPAVAALLDLRRNETVGARNRERDKTARPAWMERLHVRSRPVPTRATSTNPASQA